MVDKIKYVIGSLGWVGLGLLIWIVLVQVYAGT